MTEQITEAGNVFGSLFEKFMCTSRCRRRVLRKRKNLARYTFPILLQRNSQRVRQPSRIDEIASAKHDTKRFSQLVKTALSKLVSYNWKRCPVSEKVPRQKTTVSIAYESNNEAKCIDPWIFASWNTCISWRKNYVKNKL